MLIKLNAISKALCFLSLVLCLLFTACKQPEGNDDDDDDIIDDPYENPIAGTSRDIVFSVDSGLYSVQFNLTITTVEGRTIYYSTDGSVPSPEKVGNGFVFIYEEPILIQDRTGAENVLATPENIDQMYLVQDDPRGSIPTYYIPNKNQVPKATVIRAIAVNAGGKKSDVVTKTYFIGNNLQNYANHRILSLVSDPYNLVDQTYGIMVRGDPANRWDGLNLYNFRMKGDAWERPAHLEIFEGDATSRSVKVSTGVGIRVRGAYSRAQGQKSLTVYFKELYGINNLKDYNLIPGAVKADGSPVEKYKGFMLRSGANDSEYTKFYDLFLQELLNDRSFSTQAGGPCIVYLNGEYWGPYNLQERYSDNHTENKYGVAKENVISYDNDELDDGNAGEEALWEDLADGVIGGTITYAQFCEKFDIDNFIDYWAAQLYIYNEDWPHNNFRLFRTRAVEPDNPYGDTKWRYQMFDTEFAMGIYVDGKLVGSAGLDAFAEILDGEHNQHRNNKLFKKLMENTAFCRKFVNTTMDLYNVNFHPDTFEPLLTRYAQTYKPLMGDENTPGTYFSRWGDPHWHNYDEWVHQAYSYLHDIRDAMVYNYLPTYFGSYIGNPYDVTLSATGYNTPIAINTVTVTPNWTGKYYASNPITVTAGAAPAGYEFDGWTVTGGTAATPAALTTTVTITGNAQITAKYKVTTPATVPATGITLNNTTLNLTTGGNATLTAAVAPDNATYQTVFWASSNPAVASVDNSGKVTAISGGTATITASTVEKSATCTVTVTAVVTGVSVDVSALNVFEGDSVKLTAAVAPTTAPNKQTRWSSSAPAVATVTNDGMVTGVSAGTANITVTTVDGNRTATCAVTVKTVAQANVLLDLAARLETLSAGPIADWSAWGAAFYDLPISPAGNFAWTGPDYEDGPDVSHPAEVTFAIIEDGGKKKLQVNDFKDWASGLNITIRPLQAGDRIEIIGTFLNGPNNSASGGLLANSGCGFDKGDGEQEWWRPLGGWNPSFTAKNTIFTKTFVLSVEDAEKMNSNPWNDEAFKLRMNGLSQADGSVVPTGIGSFSVEQIKVYSAGD